MQFDSSIYTLKLYISIDYLFLLINICKVVNVVLLVDNLIEHLCINSINYFMYQWGGGQCGLSPTPKAPASQPSRRRALHQ
jgi:hypothetical protein